jgi:hypothetical protein
MELKHPVLKVFLRKKLVPAKGRAAGCSYGRLPMLAVSRFFK